MSNIHLSRRLQHCKLDASKHFYVQEDRYFKIKAGIFWRNGFPIQIAAGG